MRRYCSVIKFAILTLWLQSSATLAAINIQIAETGGDVVVSASGSFDTSQCSSSALGTASPLLFSGSGSTDVLIGVGGNNLLCVVNFSANPAGLFGGDTSQLASTSLGDFVGFGVLPDEVFLPDAYVSGSPLSGSSTYTGQTLASLNLNVGAYTFVAGTESVTVIVNAAAAPVSVSALPNWALALLGLMIAGLAVVFLGQRKKA
jgi:hypothetical protein